MFSGPIGSLNFGVSLVLDPNVNPPWLTIQLPKMSCGLGQVTSDLWEVSPQGLTGSQAECDNFKYPRWIILSHRPNLKRITQGYCTHYKPWYGVLYQRILSDCSCHNVKLQTLKSQVSWEHWINTRKSRWVAKLLTKAFLALSLHGCLFLGWVVLGFGSKKLGVQSTPWWTLLVDSRLGTNLKIGFLNWRSVFLS